MTNRREDGNNNSVPPELFKMFDGMDADGSGRISARELHTVLTSQGDRVTLEACCLLIGLFDNGVGSIDIYGFARLFVLFVNWTRVFKNFDTDNSGFIDRRELMVAVMDLYPKHKFSWDYVDMLITKFGDPWRQQQGLTDEQFLFACAFIEKMPPTEFSFAQWDCRE